MSDLVRLNDGEIVVYKRRRSSAWQARFKIPDGRWRRFSTKEAELEEAKKVATEEHNKIRLLADMGFEIDATGKGGISFGDVCGQYAVRLQEDISAGLGKPVYDSYLSVLNSWLIPYFDKMPIKSVDEQAIEDFERHRSSQLGREPAKPTINTHNVVFRAVFDHAAKKKYITRAQIPVFTVKNKGRKSKRRPDFSLEEYRDLYRFMRRWAGDEKGNWISRYKRKLMREYVLFLANSGLRPGREALELTWNCIEEDWQAPNGNTYIRIWVNKSKHGERRIIARNSIKWFLERVRELTRRTEPDDKVFCMPDGASPKDMSAMFTRLLIDANLLYDRSGKRRTLYSLRHTYATFRLAYRNVDYRRLAKQMGTSIGMIERHYAHDEPERYPDEFGI